MKEWLINHRAANIVAIEVLKSRLFSDVEIAYRRGQIAICDEVMAQMLIDGAEPPKNAWALTMDGHDPVIYVRDSTDKARDAALAVLWAAMETTVTTKQLTAFRRATSAEARHTVVRDAMFDLGLHRDLRVDRVELNID